MTALQPSRSSAASSDPLCPEPNCQGQSSECRPLAGGEAGINCEAIGVCRASAECSATTAPEGTTCQEGAGTCDGQGACLVPDKSALGVACTDDAECADSCPPSAFSAKSAVNNCRRFRKGVSMFRFLLVCGFSALVAGLFSGCENGHATADAASSAGADALVRAFESGEPPAAVRPHSYADSINVGRPRNALKALEAIRRSAGAFVRVEDEAIREAQRVLSRHAGVFGEPAGVAGLAGLLAAREGRLVEPGERIVVLPLQQPLPPGIDTPADLELVRRTYRSA